MTEAVDTPEVEAAAPAEKPKAVKPRKATPKAEPTTAPKGPVRINARNRAPAKPNFGEGHVVVV